MADRGGKYCNSRNHVFTKTMLIHIYIKQFTDGIVSSVLKHYCELGIC